MATLSASSTGRETTREILLVAYTLTHRLMDPDIQEASILAGANSCGPGPRRRTGRLKGPPFAHLVLLGYQTWWSSAVMEVDREVGRLLTCDIMSISVERSERETVKSPASRTGHHAFMSCKRPALTSENVLVPRFKLNRSHVTVGPKPISPRESCHIRKLPRPVCFAWIYHGSRGSVLVCFYVVCDFERRK
jgi:hypothetical protein